MLTKLTSKCGLVRLTWILIAVASVLAVFVLGIPLYHYFVDRSDAYGCGSALATANDQLKISYLADKENPTAEEAKQVVTYAMDGWDDLCPGGGDCYIVSDDDTALPYKVVCALHEKDTNQANLLNARSALSQLQAAAQEARQTYQDLSAEITVTLNSEEFTAVFDSTETVIQPTRRTLRKAGGALIAYDTEDGVISWFCYADKNYVRTWDLSAVGSISHADGWTLSYV